MGFEVIGKDILYVSRQRRFRLCIAENVAEYAQCLRIDREPRFVSGPPWNKELGFVILPLLLCALQHKISKVISLCQILAVFHKMLSSGRCFLYLSGIVRVVFLGVSVSYVNLKENDTAICNQKNIAEYQE